MWSLQAGIWLLTSGDTSVLEACKPAFFDKFGLFCDIFLLGRVISVVTSHQDCNTLAAHSAYPSVGDCYYSFNSHLISNMAPSLSLTYLMDTMLKKVQSLREFIVHGQTCDLIDAK